MKLIFEIWRQEAPVHKGQFKTYEVNNLDTNMSFLEALDVLNEQLLREKKEEPVAFDYDCREGICGMCSLVINGEPHGPLQGVTTCQLHLRSFKDSERITVEPWRAKSFPIVRDLVTDRSAFDRIISSGGYISVNTGSAGDANAIPIEKAKADQAFDVAACIGCGACVATCKNSSAMLFVAAKVTHLSALKQGEVEKEERVLKMMTSHDMEGFGSCSQTKSCEAVCPKNISTAAITALNREYLRLR